MTVPLKHSTSVPFSARVAVPLSVDEKEVALVPNPASGLAVKVSFGPQTEEDVLDVCTKKLPSPNLFATQNLLVQVVIPIGTLCTSAT